MMKQHFFISFLWTIYKIFKRWIQRRLPLWMPDSNRPFFFAKKETKPVNYERGAVILLVTHTWETVSLFPWYHRRLWDTKIFLCARGAQPPERGGRNMRGGSVTALNRQASFKQHKTCFAFIKHITTNVCPQPPLDLTPPGYLQPFPRTSELAKNKVSVDGTAVRQMYT